MKITESFNSAGGLVQYFKGLNTEHKLLSKLIKANLADPNDTERMIKIDEILKDAICPCCGNPAKQTMD